MISTTLIPTRRVSLPSFFALLTTVTVVIALVPIYAGAVDIDLALTPANVTVFGADAFHQCGFSVAVGDINGDNNDDLIVASYGAQPLGGLRRGEIDILWGPLASGTQLDLAAPPSSSVSRVFGKSADNPIFCRIAVGDVNGDDRDDILYAHPYGPDSWLDGMAYLILGSSTFPDTLDLQGNPTGVIRIMGGPWSGSLGWAVAFGDINNDGYDEAILSAPRLTNGEVYLIRGSASLLTLYDMTSPPSGVTRVIDYRANNWTGESLCCRDVNNDGFEDLLIGSPGNIAGARYGMASLVFGRSNLPSSFQLSDPSFHVVEFFGEAYPDGRLGMAVQLANVDGDLDVDVVLSAPYTDQNCFDCGTTYVIYDATQLPDTVQVGQGSATESIFRGEANYHAYGSTLLATNWIGDARDDIVVRSKPDSSPSARARLVVVTGSPALPPSLQLHTDPTLTRIYEATAGDHLGRGLAAGDLNGDDVMDIVTGADFADPLGRSNAGICYVLFGSGTTSSVEGETPELTVKLNYPNPFSGSTAVSYKLNSNARVEVLVYDVRGRRVARLREGQKGPGDHTFSWNGRDEKETLLPSGVYFYQLSAGAVTAHGKLLIVR